VDGPPLTAADTFGVVDIPLNDPTGRNNAAAPAATAGVIPNNGMDPNGRFAATSTFGDITVDAAAVAIADDAGTAAAVLGVVDGTGVDGGRGAATGSGQRTSHSSNKY
jgi:hypothetical protein